MKHLLNLTEAAIILCLVIIIVLPEITYSILLRARDKAVEMWGEIV